MSAAEPGGAPGAVAVASPAPGGVEVRAEDLRREHAGGIVAVDGVSLVLSPGEFVALTGPSGSGKSSLLALLGALDRPTSGRVVVGGVDLFAHGADTARYHREVVGFVFQHHNLMAHLSARANVELAMLATGRRRGDRHARAVALLQEVGLGHRLDALAPRLSGGERQRVALARALSNDPQLLLADEPTGSLDSAAAARVLALLEDVRRARGTTLLVVSYDERIAAHADRVLHLRDGRLVGS